MGHLIMGKTVPVPFNGLRKHRGKTPHKLNKKSSVQRKRKPQ